MNFHSGKRLPMQLRQFPFQHAQDIQIVFKRPIRMQPADNMQFPQVRVLRRQLSKPQYFLLIHSVRLLVSFITSKGAEPAT